MPTDGQEADRRRPCRRDCRGRRSRRPPAARNRKGSRKRATRNMFSAFCERKPAARSRLTVLSSTSALRRLKRSTIWRTERLFWLRSDALLRRLGVHPGAFAGADLFALGRNGFHPLVEIARSKKRNGKRVEGGEDGDRDQDGDRHGRIGQGLAARSCDMLRLSVRCRN